MFTKLLKVVGSMSLILLSFKLIYRRLRRFLKREESMELILLEARYKYFKLDKESKVPATKSSILFESSPSISSLLLSSNAALSILSILLRLKFKIVRLDSPLKVLFDGTVVDWKGRRQVFRNEFDFRASLNMQCFNFCCIRQRGDGEIHVIDCLVFDYTCRQVGPIFPVASEDITIDLFLTRCKGQQR
jgi:hypothetical protein